jgi:hypothetical protein
MSNGRGMFIAVVTVFQMSYFITVVASNDVIESVTSFLVESIQHPCLTYLYGLSARLVDVTVVHQTLSAINGSVMNQSM